MSEKRFVVQEDVNTDKIILLIDYKRMKMYSFLAEEREAVNKICNYLNWFDECTHNYAVMLKEIEESNCEKSKEIAKLKREIGEQQATIEAKDKEIAELDQQCADFLGDKIKALEEFEECTDKLKAKILEQQDTIQELERKLKKYAKIGEEQLKQIIELQDLCGQSDSENAKLRQEIKELKQQRV